MKKNKILNILIILLFLMVSLVGCAYAFSFRNMTLNFIDISDTHISDRQDTLYKALGSSKDLLKDAVEQINNINGIDFVLFTGDMVDSSTEDNFESYFKILSRLKYPYLNAFGNHDFYSMSKDDVLEIFKQNNENYTFDDTYYAFSPKTDYRIIVLDSTIKGENTANGELNQEQLEFLDKELSENQDKIVLIAMHHPSVEPFVSVDHSLINAKSFNEILLKYKNPIIVVSGHYHAAKINRVNNLIFVSTPSMVTYPMGFRHIKITNYKDRVNFEFKFIPTTLEDIRDENKLNVMSHASLNGLEKDRTDSFIYFKKRCGSARAKRAKINRISKQNVATQKEIKKYNKQLDDKTTDLAKAQKEKKKCFSFKKKSQTTNNKESKKLEKSKIKNKFKGFSLFKRKTDGNQVK